MIKFSKIQGFNNAVKYARSRREWPHGAIEFEGTTKLHGTNAGVLVRADGSMTAQSRNRALSLDSDNCGFAAFALESRRAAFLAGLAGVIGKSHAHDDSVVVYGEWCGPGIQKGCAVNKMHDKHFVVFAAALVLPNGDKQYVQLPPVEVHTAPELRIRSVREGPVWRLNVDLMSRESCEAAAVELNRLTDSVDAHCPWSMSVFGIDGVGEGIVWRPLGDLASDSDLFFKVKGAKHGEKGAAKKARTAPPRLESVDRFVAFAVTDERCGQAVDFLREMGKPIDMRSTGDYMRRISEDVAAECSDDLTDNGLEWKQVAKAVSAEAIRYWKQVADD